MTKETMAFHRAAVVLFVLKLLSSLTEGKETQVSCVFYESCVLPCSFQSGSDPVIHWTKTPGDVPVHIYYHSRDQLLFQNQDFKDRTSLFVDQISRGNASLLLREVKVQDEGTYKCYTSTAHSDSKESFIYLRVHAPVRAVGLEPRGNELKCSSEDIYPKPAVTWSSSNKTEPKTSVSVSEKGLYSIFSSVPLSHKPPEEHSCNISTDHSWSSATYRLQPPINSTGPNTILHCAASNSPIKSLIWKFNQTQTILTQTGTKRVYNESWRQFVEEVSESDLTLKNLDSGHQGVYSCVLSSDRETLISRVLLERVLLKRVLLETEEPKRRTEAEINTVGIIVGVIAAVILVAVIVAVIVVVVLKKKRKDPDSQQTSPAAQNTESSRAPEEIPLTGLDETSSPQNSHRKTVIMSLIQTSSCCQKKNDC